MKKPSIKKPNIKNILPKWSSKNIRKGSYSLGISVVVLAIAVVFNLVVGKLPAQYRNVDLSQTKLSTIGDTTKELVSNLDQDVTIYQIAESGSENRDDSETSELLRGSFLPCKSGAPWIRCFTRTLYLNIPMTIWQAIP